MSYGYKVVKGPAALAELGWPTYVGHPFVMDSRPGYAVTPNAYLIDRALGVWDPRGRGTKRNVRLAKTSLVDYACWLANALEWAEKRGIDLMHADYTTVLIARYQSEMLTGKWSERGVGLSPATVNLRVDAVVDYQLWGADKGLRAPTEIPTVTRTVTRGSATSSRGHHGRTVETRRGKVAVPKRRLTLPPDEWIAGWRRRVKSRPGLGTTEELIADLILHTAIRVSEAACWRLDTLPLSQDQWVITNPNQPEASQLVEVHLEYGTKGPDLVLDEKSGDKIGKSEVIKIPLHLAKRIHEYRSNIRPNALKPALKRATNVAQSKKVLADSVHLFINPRTGLRYSVAQIQYFWKLAKGPRCPYEWSPHMGRHYWACETLEQRMKAHTALIEAILQVPGLTHEHPLLLALKDTASTVITMEIQPQLRHSGQDTTMVYLTWLVRRLGIALNLSSKWQQDDV